MKKLAFCLFTFILSTHTLQAQQIQPWLTPYSAIYQKELGTIGECNILEDGVFRVCSEALKNDGNAPYVLHHGKPTAKTAVLFHGLSDSPYFFRSIAPLIHAQGYTVIVALLPGHGKKQADEDMEDSKLAARWIEHVNDVMNYADSVSEQVYIGGFSTGGALSTLYVLDNPDRVKGMMLFSGALALDESVESMAGYWGIKWLSKMLDGDYETMGPNPYKYPSVAKHSAFMLTDIIFAIREKIEQGAPLDLPIFTAHSMADNTTPWRGIESLLAVNGGEGVKFILEKDLDVCHADVVVSAQQLVDMQFDASAVEEPEKCSIPKANPKHPQMLEALTTFVKTY
jgi:pimeloyl-ACP methyl ester carboxylesterase